MRPLPAAFCLLSLAAVPWIAAPVLSQAPSMPARVTLPIRQVTLYTSGVGFFQRSGAVNGNAAEVLHFPLSAINDILKSLVLLDRGGGTIEPVTYAAKDPIERQLQDFSIDLSSNPSRAALLSQLRGTSVTVTTPQQTLSGTVLGVETKTIQLPDKAGTTQSSILNLITPNGVYSVPLATVSVFKINDPKVNQEITQALSVIAQGRDANTRPVTLHFDGHGRRDVSVGYLTETPLWETTYRLVLGAHPALQGWALVQNTSQDDWNNVRLTLVSGRPISFIQDLYTPEYVPRPVVAPQIAFSPTPQTYGSNLNGSLTAVQRDASQLKFNGGTAGFRVDGEITNGTYGGRRPDMMAGKENTMPFSNDYATTIVPNGGVVMQNETNHIYDFSRAVQQSITTTGAKLGTALFSYAIQVPVSVSRGQSAMIPFVSAPVQVQPVAIYNPQVDASHPLSGARLTNTTGLHLMGGSITVFDTGANGTGYVGDALINDTEPGQSRLISYAVDQAMTAHEESGGYQEQTTSIIISNGVLQEYFRQTQITDYTLKNNSHAAQTVVVEQPSLGAQWKLLQPVTATERTARMLRFDVPVAAGASKKFVVREQSPLVNSIILMAENNAEIRNFVGNSSVSAAVKAALVEIITRRQALSDLQDKISTITSQIQSVSADQTRIRLNMNSLSKTSALYSRYVNELNAQETALENEQTQLATLKTQQQTQQIALNDYLAHLTVGQIKQ